MITNTHEPNDAIPKHSATSEDNNNYTPLAADDRSPVARQSPNNRQRATVRLQLANASQLLSNATNT